jgi:hypothetical protein
MAQPIRIQYPGAVHHEMALGSHGPEIFQDDPHRQRFIACCAPAGRCIRTGMNSSLQLGRTILPAHKSSQL